MVLALLFPATPCDPRLVFAVPVFVPGSHGERVSVGLGGARSETRGSISGRLPDTQMTADFISSRSGDLRGPHLRT